VLPSEGCSDFFEYALAMLAVLQHQHSLKLQVEEEIFRGLLDFCYFFGPDHGCQINMLIDFLKISLKKRMF